MLVLLAARERTLYWRSNAPSAGQIDSALSRAQAAARMLGHPVGPARIVRHTIGAGESSDSSRWGLWTYVAQLWTLDERRISEGTPARTILRSLLEWWDHELSAIPGTTWEPATVTAYDPARNGTLTWWSSGQAARTRTREAQADTLGNLASVNAEDPLGPGASRELETPRDSTERTVREAGEAVREGARELAREAFPWVLPLALLVGAALVLPRLADTKRAARELTSASNPRRTRARRNGRAKAWAVLGPDEPYPCKGRLVGELVPGRGGGLVTQCATPSKDQPKKGQYWLVPAGQPALPGFGHAMPKARAARRVRAQKRGEKKTSSDPVYLEEIFAEWRRSGLPQPTGLEYPHTAGSSPCDPEHPLWQEYPLALEEASERAAIEVEDPDDVTGYERARARALAAHPQAPAWDAATAKCAAGYASRVKRKRAERVDDVREAARRLTEVGSFRGSDERDEREILGDYLSEIRAEARRSKGKSKGKRR